MGNQLLAWRKVATKSEWHDLACLSGTTVGYLNAIAYGNRRASPRLAESIEQSAKNFPHRPEILKEVLVFSADKCLQTTTLTPSTAKE